MKRALDLVSSATGLLVLSPLFLLLAALIRLESAGPAFYRAVRVGRGGHPFRMLKFRTMLVDADRIGASSTPDDDPRITRIGRALRRYKLDELPQLINVVRGEMSLVGPRPQVQWAVDLYTSEQRAVLALRPGITDYASLHFPHEGVILRGSTDPDRDYMEKIHPEKMRLSLEYLRDRTLWLDVKLILQTLMTVLKRESR